MAKMQHCKIPQGTQHLCNVDQRKNVWHSLGAAHQVIVHLCRHQQLVPLMGSSGSSRTAGTTELHDGLCLTVSDAYRLESR